MNILVLGANGMLGSMMDFFGSTMGLPVLALKRDAFDVLRHPITKLMPFLTEQCCVVNCIGAIPQRSYDDASMTALNTAFPLELADLCARIAVPLIHISTNCVFSGDKPDRLEPDAVTATDAYGKSKASGEPSTCVVLRCSIIGPESTGAAAGLFEWFLHSGDSVSGYTNHYWNGVTTLELAKCIYEIIDKRLFTPRIEHIFSCNTLSKCELLEEIKQLFHKETTIHACAPGMKYYTLQSVTRSPQKTIQDQLRELVTVIPAYREFAIKDLFLVTSVIQTGSTAWSYSNIRSVFSPKERLEQTLQTISSIRALKDGSRILVCECSALDESMEQLLREKADIYVNCYAVDEIREACIHTNKKGYGELLQTKYAIDYLETHRIEFNRLLKISGRYWLTTDFDKSKISLTEYTFNERLTNLCQPTVVYSVPRHRIDHFHGVINECRDLYRNGPMSLENILPIRCIPAHYVTGIGVAGYVAVDAGRVLWSLP